MTFWTSALICCAWLSYHLNWPFSRRFRKGNSFPNFVERSILKLPPSKLCAVRASLYTTEHFSGGAGGKGRKGVKKSVGRGVANKGGKREQRMRENRSVDIHGTHDTALATRWSTHTHTERKKQKLTVRVRFHRPKYKFSYSCLGPPLTRQRRPPTHES